MRKISKSIFFLEIVFILKDDKVQSSKFKVRPRTD